MEFIMMLFYLVLSKFSFYLVSILNFVFLLLISRLLITQYYRTPFAATHNDDFGIGRQSYFLLR